MTQLTAVAPRRYPLKTAAAPAFTPDQVAQAFIDVGVARNIAVVGIQEAICCGLDESNLRVLANPSDPASEALPNDGDGYDHGSEGPLQQQAPWWGTLQCRMDPACSVGLFYDKLVQLDYTNLAAQTPGYWIQQVQNSYDPTGSNYQAQWPTAVAIYNRLASPVGIPQANIDLAISIFKARIGNQYVYGGAFDPVILNQGTDCSGMVDTILQALTHGPNMQWGRHISTESWPYNYPDDLAVALGTVGPYGTICAGDAQPGDGAVIGQIPSDAAAIIYLMHGGGGEDSHVMIAVNDGTGQYIIMETGGAHNDTGGNGPYLSPTGIPATATTDKEWTDIWYLPGPVTNGENGFLMSLTDQQQSDLYSWTGDLHGALFNSIPSQSPFRAWGEGAVWQQHQLPINDDGMTHPQYVEWAARHGDSVALATLGDLAGRDPAVLDNGVDRSADIALAQKVLTAVESGGAPVIQPPAPAPNVAPDVVVPQPVVTPASSGGINITAAQLATWGKDAVTILGTLGTWLTAVHSLLGQFLPGSSAAVVPAMLAAATTVSAGHTVHRRVQTEKANRLLLKNTQR